LEDPPPVSPGLPPHVGAEPVPERPERVEEGVAECGTESGVDEGYPVSEGEVSKRTNRGARLPKHRVSDRAPATPIEPVEREPEVERPGLERQPKDQGQLESLKKGDKNHASEFPVYDQQS